MADTKMKSGTTILGMVGTDGVLIASESRGTVGGGIIATEESEKIHEIDSHFALAGAGMGGDILTLAKMLKVESRLFKTRQNRPMRVEAAVNLLGAILHEYKFAPFYVGLLVGGVEPNGKPKLFAVDPAGDVQQVSDHTAYAGSGWLSAEAIMDDAYKKAPVKELVPIAVRAINAAKKRDAHSGGGLQMVLITKNGVKKLTKEEIAKLSAKEAKRKQ